LEILLRDADRIALIQERIQPAQILSPECRQLFVRCVELWSSGILPDFARLLLEFDDPVVKNLLVDLDEVGRDKQAETDIRLHDVLIGFERRQHDDWLRDRTPALKQRQLAQEDELAVLLEIEQQQRARQQQQEDRSRLGISDPTEG
jgi:hypothetical protein